MVQRPSGGVSDPRRPPETLRKRNVSRQVLKLESPTARKSGGDPRRPPETLRKRNVSRQVLKLESPTAPGICQAVFRGSRGMVQRPSGGVSDPRRPPETL